MSEEKISIDNPTENGTNVNNPSGKSSYGGSLFERRFMLYDKVKIPVKVVDGIIIISVILLFVFFILGAYMK